MNFGSGQPTSASAPVASPAAPQLQRATVKSVLSGDSVIVRGQPKGGPPPEKQVNLSNIIAPKLARRPTDPSTPETKDEPYAWEAREYLRQKLVGKEIVFAIDYKVPASGREYGIIYLGRDSSGENVAESLITEGLAEVRQATSNRPDEYVQRLNDLQNSAKAAGKGKWGTPEQLQKHVRDIKWSLPAQESPRNFVDSLRREPIKAVVEHVRDGSTVRAFLLPSFHYVTIMMSGIKCPGYKVGDDGRVKPQDAEPYADEAKFFTEVRVLQRDVEIILEGVTNQNFLGSIIHPNGNIAELLLKEGFAKCVDWTMATVSLGPEKYRSAEKFAKEKRLRLWKSYQPSASQSSDPSANSFTAKVIEVVMGDALVIKKDKDVVQKIWLSSVRQPRSDEGPGKDAEQKTPGRQFRPLYDIPFMFEAREFLRKRLIGKKVQVQVDYVQPANQPYPERMCCTVLIGGQNVAEALISKGLATVVRYRQGDENRSSQYDQLLAAEAKAEKTRKGIHSLKSDAGGFGGQKDLVPIVRVQDLQGDSAKSKQFFPFLQRAGRVEAVVEFVASGSRFRVYVPKETCLLTFLLSGINCPRASRTAGPGGNAQQIDAQPFGDEALHFVKDLCLQHEVEIEVEALDKGGNYVGYMFLNIEGSGEKNLSTSLVEQGLAKVHFTAERSRHYNALKEAEERAKAVKRGLWSLPENQVVEEEEEGDESFNKEDNKRYANGGDVDRKEQGPEKPPQYRKVVVTEVLPELKFYAQFVEQGSKLEQMMTELRVELSNQSSLVGFTPKRGELCAARFSEDNQWYRAKIESVRDREHIDVFFIDFGNREMTSASKLANLPSTFHQTPPGAKEFRLAFVQLHSDPDYEKWAIDQFKMYVLNGGEFGHSLVNVEYRDGGIEHVTLVSPTEESSGSTTAKPGVDYGRELIANGLALVKKRRVGNDRRLNNLLNDYVDAQASAKSKRLVIWQYGDFTGDEL